MRVLSILALVAVIALAAAAVAFAAFTDTTTQSTSFAASATFPPVLQSAPDLEQTSQVGAVLDVTTGAWSPTPTSLTYRWLRCNASGAACVAIAGQTAATYTAALADLNVTVRGEVTAVRGPHQTVATSEPSQATTTVGGPVVNGANPAAVSANMPQITGTTTVGSTLTSTTGSWGASAISFARQWLRCSATGTNCTAIPGANGTTYALVAADQGTRLRVRVTASTLALLANAVTSADTAVIG